jgi:hypothetical protein
MGSSAVLAESGGGEKLCQLLLGVVIRAVGDCGRVPVVFVGVNKLGEFFQREFGAAIRRIRGRSGRFGVRALGFGRHAEIIASSPRVGRQCRQAKLFCWV